MEKVIRLEVKMFNFKFMILTAIVLANAESVPTPKDNPAAKWEQDKLEILTDLIENILKFTGSSATVVASQNVYNADGSFKEIKTVELTIPNRFHRGSGINDEYTNYLEKLKENDDEFGDTVLKMQKDFKSTFENSNFDKKAAYLKQSFSGEVELELYVGKNDVYYDDDEGLGYYLRDNIISTDKKKLEEDLKKRFENSDNSTFISVLVWDTDKKFVLQESKVDPKLLVYADKASDNADEETIDFIIEGFTKYVLNDPERVAKELSAALTNLHPEYIWFVTKGQDEQAGNAKHDVYVKLTYDNVDVGDDLLQYTVFGVKKQ